MIKTLNLDRSYTSVLEKAYKIGYEKESNSIWSASFSLPLDDKKNAKVKQLQYVEIIDPNTNEYIGLFRIMPKKTTKNLSSNEVTYQCQHVLATLMDNVLFKYHQLTGYTTKQAIQYLIDQQKTINWKLGQVDFTRYFDYSWENENLISAIFSIPKPFDVQYRWSWDTTAYPWTLNLVTPDIIPTCRIQEGHNLVGFEIEENPNSLVNRIYPLGAGEGVNQLNITKINNGISYVEDTESINNYGLVEYVWSDKRFIDATSLKSSAIGLLNKWKQPIVSWSVSAADVVRLTDINLDALREGKVVRIVTDDFGEIDLRIFKESKSDILGDPGSIQLEIGSVLADLGTTNADLQRRQQINELYSQGATNILNFDYQDNCDENFPALIEFFVDDDVVNINTVELTFKTKKFRAYSKSTSGGGAVTATSSSGGASTQSSSSGGGSRETTDSKLDTIYVYSEIPVDFPENTLNNHIHPVSVEGLNHSHSVDIPNHTHTVGIPAHTHNVTISDHTHGIEYGIWESSTEVNSIELKVDGSLVTVSGTSCERLDIVDYLEKEESGRIKRGNHLIEIKPNTIARIEAQVIMRVFIRSQLGGEF